MPGELFSLAFRGVSRVKGTSRIPENGEREKQMNTFTKFPLKGRYFKGQVP